MRSTPVGRLARPSGDESGRTRTLIGEFRMLATVGKLRRTALGLLLALAPCSWAQVNNLPAEVVRSTRQLVPDQVDMIRGYLKDTVEGLGAAADPAKIRKARLAILEPLQDQQVSAPFRLEYSRALADKLTEFTGKTDTIVVINALFVAGELATEQGVGIVEKHLSSKDTSVRFAAIKGLAVTLDAAARRTPAIADERLLKILDSLSKSLATEEDPVVYDATARAIATGFNKDSISSAAVTQLSKPLSAWLKKNAGKPGSPERLDTLIVVSTSVRDAATKVAAGAALSASAKRDATTLGAELLGYVAAGLKAGAEFPKINAGDPEEQQASKKLARAKIRQLAALGEAIVAATVPDAPVIGAAKLVETARAEDDAGFLDGVDRILKKLPK
jgi:hypothetical protein